MNKKLVLYVSIIFLILGICFSIYGFKYRNDGCNIYKRKCYIKPYIHNDTKICYSGILNTSNVCTMGNHEGCNYTEYDCYTKMDTNQNFSVCPYPRECVNGNYVGLFEISVAITIVCILVIFGVILGSINYDKKKYELMTY